MVAIFYSDEARTIEDKSNDLVEFVKEFMPRFILWGGNDSIKAFSKFMVGVRKEQTDPTANLRATAQLFKSLRTEFGHGTMTLPDDDILRILVTDWDEHISKTANRPKHGR
jgi:hypothetical protein